MMVHSDDLTGCQRKSLLEFLNIKRKTKCNVREPLWFALVLAGEKPGCLISAQRSTVEESFPSFSLTTMAEAFNLAYTEHFEASLDIASSPWRIEMLPSKHFDLCSEAYFRRLGAFYGYPEEDVNHFVETVGWDMHPTELAEARTIDPEEAAYMLLLPHRYDATEHYERAIASGKRIRTAITAQAEQWNCTELDDYADWIYQRALELVTL